MLINYFIYFHIGVCVLLIVFEIGWGLYARIRDTKIKEKTQKYEKELQIQIDYLKKYASIKKVHKKNIAKELKKVDNLIAFERACDNVFKTEKEHLKIYIKHILHVFIDIAFYYNEKKKETEKAYLAYIIGKYFKYLEDISIQTRLIEILYQFMECKSIYCKLNTIETIYVIGTPENILRAISIINKQESVYNQSLLLNGLKNVKKNRKHLAIELFNRFEEYNKNIQIFIIKFLSDYHYIEEDLILEKLENTKTAIDVRCEIMRYFQKNKNEKAKQYLIKQLSKEEIVANDLNIKAIGTLGYYEDAEVRNLLNKLKESVDDLIKESAYRSLEKKPKIQKEQLLEVV